MLEDILRAYALQFKGNYDDLLTLMEFAYNHSYHSSIMKHCIFRSIEFQYVGRS